MHHSRVRKVLADEETLDIAATAEAVQEDSKMRERKGKPANPSNSIRAHYAWLGREQAKEAIRQKLKEIWNKNKKK